MGSLPLVIKAGVGHSIEVVTISAGSGFHSWNVPPGSVVCGVFCYSNYTPASADDGRFDSLRSDNYEIEITDFKVSVIHFERDASDPYFAAVTTVNDELVTT